MIKGEDRVLRPARDNSDRGTVIYKNEPRNSVDTPRKETETPIRGGS